jgi:uncharacterized membrane protein YiaA
MTRLFNETGDPQHVQHIDAPVPSHPHARAIMNTFAMRPTPAFVGAAWTALFTGGITYVIGLWNTRALPLNEKGYYLILLCFGLFSVVSLQKTVRDRLEQLPVSGIYHGLCWLSLGLSVLFLTVGLWHAELSTAEKGFYAMAFVLSLFAAVAVQKNVRDMAAADEQ